MVKDQAARAEARDHAAKVEGRQIAKAVGDRRTVDVKVAEASGVTTGAAVAIAAALKARRKSISRS